MKVVIRAATAAGGALAVLLCAGFSGGGHAAVPRGSVPACTAFGVRAIEHHLTVTTVPPACRGLSRSEVNLAIGRAIYTAAGAGQHKAAWRRRASVAGTRLAKLITSLPQPAGPPPSTSTGATAGTPPPPDRLPLGLATLAAWLAAAATGGYILARRVIRGGRPGRGQGRGGAVATVAFGHAGLAATGLLVWASFLVSGLAGLAWVAAGLLLPVSGLGMATLTLWSPGPRPGPAGPPGPVSGLVPTLAAASSTSGRVAGTPAGAEPGPAPPPAAAEPGPSLPSAGGPGSQGRPRSPGRLTVILPVVHGLAAMAAILLALLTAVGAG
jgi:hypothetical protein